MAHSGAFASRHSSRLVGQRRSPMDPALATSSNTAFPTPVVFQDGLRERRRAPDPSGAETLERLHLREELTAIPSFEFALRERASRLSAFRHAYYARVRCVDR